MTTLAAPATPTDATAAVGGRLDVPQGAALTIGAVLGTGVISLLPELAHDRSLPRATPGLGTLCRC